jgi:hypothetical protein
MALLAGPIGNGLRDLARRHRMEPPAEISAISLCAPGILLQETAGQTSTRAQPASRSPSERSAHGSFGTDFASERAPTANWVVGGVNGNGNR